MSDPTPAKAPEGVNLSDPTSFQAALAQAKAADEAAMGAQEDADAPDPQEEGADAPEDAAQGDGEDAEQEDEAKDGGEDKEDDDGAPVIPRARLNKEAEKRRLAEEKAAKAESEAAALKSQQDSFNRAVTEWLEKNGEQSGDDSAADGEGDELDPLDPDAHKLYKKGIEEAKKIAREAKEETQRMVRAEALRAQQDSFKKDAPDWDDAWAHVKNIELAKAKRFYPDVRQAQAAAGATLKAMADKALERGENAAKVFYDLAQDYGYAPKSAKKSANGPDHEAIARNRAKSSSVSSLPAGGAAPTTVAEMTSKEGFQKLKTKTGAVDPKQFHKLLNKINSKGAYA